VLEKELNAYDMHDVETIRIWYTFLRFISVPHSIIVLCFMVSVFKKIVPYKLWIRITVITEETNLQDRKNIEDTENILDTIGNITKYSKIHDSEIL
jgi:hypothetical protein